MNTSLLHISDLFDLLTKATGDAIWHWDLSSDSLWWNEGYTRLFGYAVSEGNTDGLTLWSQHVHPDDRPRVVTSIEQTIAAGKTDWADEYRFARADGSYAVVYDRGYVLYNNGKAVHMVGAMQDVTDRIQLQQKWADSEERLRFALQSAQLGTWEMDPINGVVRWDKLCQEICGLTDEPVVAFDRTVSFIHPDDRERVTKAVEWALNPASGGGYNMSFRTVRQNSGEQSWVRFIGQTAFTKTGQAYRFSGVARDITAEIQAGEKAAQSEEQAKLALDASGAGSFWIDLKNRQMRYSTVFVRIMTGEDRSDLSHDVFIDKIYPADRPVRKKAHELALRTGSLNYEARFVWTDGSIRWISIQGQYQFDPSGEAASIIGIALDVTEQKKQNQALREAEARFTIAFNNTSVGMAFVDSQANFTSVNPAYTQLLGYSAEELCTMNSFGVTHPDDRELNRQLFAEVVEGKRPFFTLFKRYIHRDLSERWVQINGTRVADARDETQSMMLIAYDFTEQFNADARLRQNEARFRNMITNAPVAIGILNGPDLVVETANTSMLSVWGKSTDILGVPLEAGLPEADRQELVRAIRGAYASGNGFYTSEMRLPVRRGDRKEDAYFNVVCAPVRSENDTVTDVIVVASDVTGQVLNRAALQESELRFRTLLEAIPQITWTSTPTGEMTFYNQRWYNYTGIHHDQPADWTWESMIHPDDLQNTLNTHKRAVASPSAFSLENRYRRGSDGMYRWHLNQAIPIHDESGKVMVWVNTATDIHEQKELEASLEEQIQARTEQLTASNDDLRRSNENLEKFAYIASHDLQEPLRKVQSFGDILRSQYGGQLGAGADYLERMQTAAGRMSQLIRDLLTFSRISTRQDVTAPVDLNQVLAEVLEALEVTIDETDAQVDVELMPTILGDASQLRQLFQNLISNGLKFQKKGVRPYVQVRSGEVSARELPVGVHPSRPAGRYYCIQVIDNGIGFDEKYLDRIFQVFQRLHGRSEYTGTGIGLAICEKVAANHGGTITASSRPGQGASFIVYLPVAQPGV